MNEINRQCEMAWQRGHDLGMVKGIAYTGLTSCFILLILLILGIK